MSGWYNTLQFSGGRRLRVLGSGGLAVGAAQRP